MGTTFESCRQFSKVACLDGSQNIIVCENFESCVHNILKDACKKLYAILENYRVNQKKNCEYHECFIAYMTELEGCSNDVGSGGMG